MKTYHIKRIEKLILAELDRGNFCVHNALSNAVRYFAIFDKLEHTRHSELMRKLYCTPPRMRRSILNLSLEEHLSDRTLYRYREKYLNCLIAFLRLEAERNAAAVSTLRALNEARTISLDKEEAGEYNSFEIR